jgi:hypothetical protein
MEAKRQHKGGTNSIEQPWTLTLSVFDTTC